LLGGTYTIDWFLKDFLQQPDALKKLTDEAVQLAPGAEGLTLLPYWNSAMNPYWDEKASGVMVGWRGIHRPAHVFRAILEGIACELRLQSDGVAAATGVAIERYLAMGGGAQSDLWCQIIADVGGRSVQRATEPEAAALGAAMLAGIGAGCFADSQEAVQAMVKVSETVFEPDAERHSYYEQRYQQVYLPLYPALKPILGALNEEL
jgi:xylulokinase